MLLKANITFNGNAEEALNFYQQVFQGEIVHLLRYEDVLQHMSGENLPEEYRKRIVNARLDFGNCKFNVSDAAPGQPLLVGNNVAMDLVFFEETGIREIFGKLSEGGQVIMPLAPTYFSPNFAVFTDKFGVCWNIMQMHD